MKTVSFKLSELRPSTIYELWDLLEPGDERVQALDEQYQAITGQMITESSQDAADTQQAVRVLNETDDELASQFADEFKPEPLATIVRQHLPNPDQRMTQGQKKFWIAFADQLGPDWLAPFHHVSGFMKKVDEF